MKLVNGHGWFTVLITRVDKLNSYGLCFGYQYIGITIGQTTQWR